MGNVFHGIPAVSESTVLIGADNIRIINGSLSPKLVLSEDYNRLIDMPRLLKLPTGPHAMGWYRHVKLNAVMRSLCDYVSLLE